MSIEGEPTGGEQPHLARPAERGLENPRKAEEQQGANPGETIVFPGELLASHNHGEMADISHHRLATPSDESIAASPQDTPELEKLERRRAYMREWRQKHPDKHRQNVARWARSERGKEYDRAYKREYRRKRNEGAKPQDPAALERLARRRAYQREWQRRWYQQHPEEGRQRARDYRRKRKAEGSSQ
jgi:hypothetical protein